MNAEVFNQAKQAYSAGEYNQALQLLTDCLKDPNAAPAPGEIGLLYHQIGNCLVKLNNYNEAIQSYTQATADNAYSAVGSVNYNLGMAYAALGDYEDAINHFEIAVSDGRYDTPYKAYLAMGNALMKLGKSAEAGFAFRTAALDEHNPNPSRALLNLGVCFMALNRPSDAVVSYESALQFDMDSSLKNKLYANLGQAYVSCGQYQNACHAFEQALADKTYYLSDSASVDYQRAVGAVAQGMADTSATFVDTSAAASDEVFSQETMSFPAATADYASGQDANAYVQNGEYATSAAYGQDPNAAKALVSQDAQSDYFAQNNAANEQWDKLSNAAPKKRHLGLKIAIFIVVLLIAAVGVGLYFYTQGYGYPTQETVVTELFNDPDAAADELFADGLNDATVTSLLSTIQEDKNVSIDGVNKSMSTSVVYATTTLTGGGKVTYEISLVRDVISWKISDIEIYHTSQA